MPGNESFRPFVGEKHVILTISTLTPYYICKSLTYQEYQLFPYDDPITYRVFLLIGDHKGSLQKLKPPRVGLYQAIVTSTKSGTSGVKKLFIIVTILNNFHIFNKI